MELNKIYNEDCLVGMNRIPDKCVDMIFTDLPFGTTNCKWDVIIPFDKMWAQYNRIIKDNGAILLFAQTPFDKLLGASNISMLRYEWIWEKSQATGHYNAKKAPMKAHENILVFYKKPPTYNPQKTQGHKPMNSYTKYVETQNNTQIYGRAKLEMSGGGQTDRYPRSVLKFPSDKQKSCLHSTQKPVALCEYFIKTYTNPGDLMVDTCAGVLSSIIACENLGRKYIAFEDDVEIYNEGMNRMNEYKTTK